MILLKPLLFLWLSFSAQFAAPIQFLQLTEEQVMSADPSILTILEAVRYGQLALIHAHVSQLHINEELLWRKKATEVLIQKTRMAAMNFRHDPQSSAKKVRAFLLARQLQQSAEDTLAAASLAQFPGHTEF